MGKWTMSRMKDVAERCGVSKTTVSHVVNQTRYVAPETRRKVLAAMRELNYHGNAHARRLGLEMPVGFTSLQQNTGARLSRGILSRNWLGRMSVDSGQAAYQVQVTENQEPCEARTDTSEQTAFAAATRSLRGLPAC